MPLSRELQSRAAIVTKGILFGVLGVFSAGILLLEFFSWRHLALLAIAIWAFSRASYFAFYVIEKYVAGEFRYAGLFDFAKYLAHRKRS